MTFDFELARRAAREKPRLCPEFSDRTGIWLPNMIERLFLVVVRRRIEGGLDLKDRESKD